LTAFLTIFRIYCGIHEEKPLKMSPRAPLARKAEPGRAALRYLQGSEASVPAFLDPSLRVTFSEISKYIFGTFLLMKASI
jgi:hypothetical protein